jgi:hypothetical protein
MLKKLFIIAFVIVAIAGCAKEEQQADVDTPVASTVEAEATHPCKHHEGVCTCEGHEGETCPHAGEGKARKCESCGHEWKCEGPEAGACRRTDEGCVCTCPECGAETKFECGGHGAKGHKCTGKCDEGCTWEGSKGKCPHGDEHSSADNPGYDVKMGCPVVTSGQPACSGKGSCKSQCGS